jgi:hypothetical protein
MTQNDRSQKITSDDVRKSISESFADTEYPGDSRLVVLDPETDYDSGQIFERLQIHTWQQLLSHLEGIDGPDLYWYSSVYTMLTPEAFIYYLPAFLIVCMDLDRVDTVSSYLVYRMLDSKYTPGIYTALALLPVQQRSAIRLWVRYLDQEYPKSEEVELLKPLWLEGNE